MVNSGFTEFKLANPETQDLARGDVVVLSKRIIAGEYSWRVDCYPCGCEENGHGEFLCLFLFLVSGAKNFNAFFEAFLLGAEGAPSSSHAKMWSVLFSEASGVRSAGCHRFAKRSDLESLFATNGVVRLVCGVIVLHDSPVAVPASDIGDHLGRLLDRVDGSDVSFSVGGETFHAHRAVLAARSPVLRAELFGSMADAKVPRIMLQDIDPITFKAMLRFMYTDALPTEKELGGSPLEMFQRLLAAAHRYALDRLKLVCAQRLLDNLSADTALHCAEMYNCPELKERCMDLFMTETNFKKAVLTEGFVRLVQKFPSIIAELRKRAGA